MTSYRIEPQFVDKCCQKCAAKGLENAFARDNLEDFKKIETYFPHQSTSHFVARSLKAERNLWFNYLVQKNHTVVPVDEQNPICAAVMEYLFAL